MNSSDMAYERDNFLLAMFGEERICETPDISLQEQLKECNQALIEYQMMLDNAIWFDNQREIKQLRKEIQHIKVEKRNIQKAIKKGKGVAYT